MPRVRSVLACLTLLVLVLPASAQAGSLTRETDTRVGLLCEGVVAGNTELFLFTETSDAFGSYTDLAIWTGGGSSLPDAINGASTILLTPTGGSGSVELVEFDEFSEDPFGDPAGTATLSVSLAPSGPAEPYEFTDRDGNSTIRVEGVFQPLSVSGTLTVDPLRGRDTTFDLTTCSAWTDTYTFSNTNPSTYVFSDQQVVVECSWQLDRGFVQLFAVSDQFGTFSDVYIVDGRNEYFGFTTPALTPTSFDADYTLRDADGGDAVGSASASATLTRTDEQIDIRDHSGNVKFSASGWVLAVNGSVTIDAGRTNLTLAMDETSCSASDVRVKEIISKTTGPRLKNDTPSGALPLAIGDTVEVKTGGTQLEPEAPCTVEFDGHVAELPFAHTAWWTFTGTGGDVSIDTAGSDFDTIVAVYVSDGGTFDQVGCVDDVFDPATGEGSLQSSITVATEAGQTYYVQAGGFGDSAGTLRLRIE